MKDFFKLEPVGPLIFGGKKLSYTQRKTLRARQKEIIKLLKEVLFYVKKPHYDWVSALGCHSGINNGVGPETYHEWNIRHHGKCYCRRK